MADLPIMKPRDMHALIAQTVQTHVEVRDNIANAATAREEYYDKLNKDLNASARLQGKTTT
jgi:hypothetical protein